jgi:arginase
MNETRDVAFLGAPSSLGIRPYDDGEIRHSRRSPHVFRELGLVTRLGATDLGDVLPGTYVDFERPPGRARNEEAVADYSRRLAHRVAHVIRSGQFALVIGGECSVVLGSMLGARAAYGSEPGAIGLAYVDGHADFATPSESVTGSVASMCLAMAVGRGDTPLARLAGEEPLVAGRHVALIGRRDEAEAWYGHTALHESGIEDVTGAELRRLGPAAVSQKALNRLTSDEIAGFWIHVDADVLDASVMPAVDSPLGGGPGFVGLTELLAPLVTHPKALGMELTIYDPKLDPGLGCAKQLIELLAELLSPHRAHGTRLTAPNAKGTP